MSETQTTAATSHLFRSFSAFLEVMYDPYLTWRSFVRGHSADYSRLSYKPHSVHVEIVPFIYGELECMEYYEFTQVVVLQIASKRKNSSVMRKSAKAC